MLELDTTATTPRDELLRLVRSRLHHVVPQGRLVAEGILGAEARVDFVAVESSGRVVLVLVGAEGDDLALIGRAVAQRGWVGELLADWHQLAPDLGIRPEAGVGVCVLAPVFSEESRAAARALGDDAVRLIRFHGVRNGAGIDVLVEKSPHDPRASIAAHPAPVTAEPASGPPPIDRPGGTPAARPALPETPAAAFRTGLTHRDLGLSREERGEFE